MEALPDPRAQRSVFVRKVVNALADLSTLQARFVELYLLGDQDTFGRAKESAIAAGYSPKNADVQAAKLLKNPKVVAAVDAIKIARVEHQSIDHNRYVELCLEQANAWKDTNTGKAKKKLVTWQDKIIQIPVVEEDPNNPGAVRPKYLRSHDGDVLIDPRTGDPMVEMHVLEEEMRPNGANVRALELAGKSLGHLSDQPQLPRGGDVNVNVHLPQTGYPDHREGKEVGVQDGGVQDAVLMEALSALPSPDDISSGEAE